MDIGNFLMDMIIRQMHHRQIVIQQASEKPNIKPNLTLKKKKKKKKKKQGDSTFNSFLKVHYSYC